MKASKPLTSAQKQQRRRSALDAIAASAGWPSWDAYATAVKRGEVRIARLGRRARGRGDEVLQNY